MRCWQLLPPAHAEATQLFFAQHARQHSSALAAGEFSVVSVSELPPPDMYDARWSQ
jgi:hypothetical protein